MKMINEDSILTKLNGDGRSYWSLMDTLGHIHEIPEELLNILEKEDNLLFVSPLTAKA